MRSAHVGDAQWFYNRCVRSIIDREDESENLEGLRVLAAVFAIIASVSLLYAVLLWMDRVPFTAGAWLIGAEAARMGPTIYLVWSIGASLAALAMLRRNRWGRWTGVAMLAWMFVQQVPVVSAAVVEIHIAAIIRSGATMIVSVASLWYLFQERVRERFEK